MLWRSSLVQCRPLHTYVQRAVWNKAHLRKLKKNELLELAQEHNIDPTGTKNELISRLAAFKDPKVARHPDVVPDSTSTKPASSTPTPTPTPTPSTPPTTLEPIASTPAVESTRTTEPEDEGDLEWAKAFALRASQRTSKPISNNAKKLPAKPHPLAPSPPPLTKPVEQVELETPKVETELKPETDENDAPEDVNVAWMKAFEQKVGTHGARGAPSTKSKSSTIMPDSLKTVANETPIENPIDISALKQSLSSSTTSSTSSTSSTPPSTPPTPQSTPVSSPSSSTPSPPPPSPESPSNVGKDWAPASNPADQGQEDMLREMLEMVQKDQAEAIARENAESELHRQTKKNKTTQTNNSNSCTEMLREKHQSSNSSHESNAGETSSRDMWINGTIGASVLVWLTMGEDGLKELFKSKSKSN
ncbi:hypothetical protein F4703DRAFT_1881119 [Phycomyces blakesleeanus]